MKKEYTILNEIKITAHNKREDQLVRIIKSQIADVLNDLAAGEDIGKRLCGDTFSHWRVKQIAGELDACFFMGMIKDATCDIAVWDLINKEYWERMGWNA